MRKTLATLAILLLFGFVPAGVSGEPILPTGFEGIRAPFKGPEDAPVTILEISDFM